MKTIEDIKLIDIIPDSITHDKKVTNAAGVIDPHLQAIVKNATLPAIYTNLEILPSLLLDHLAHQYNILPWRDYWDKSKKISVLNENIALKRKRGTLSAVKRAIESLGADVEIVQWYDQTPAGTPGTFRINVSLYVDNTVMAEAQEDAMTMLAEMKPVSRHYELRLELLLSGGIGVYGTQRHCVYSRIDFN